jgi:hypothetical protein
MAPPPFAPRIASGRKLMASEGSGAVRLLSPGPGAGTRQAERRLTTGRNSRHVASQIEAGIGDSDVHSGPSDHVPWPGTRWTPSSPADAQVIRRAVRSEYLVCGSTPTDMPSGPPGST